MNSEEKPYKINKQDKETELVDVLKSLDNDKKEKMWNLVKDYITEEEKFARAKEYIKFKKKQKIIEFIKNIFQWLLILTPFIIIWWIFYKWFELFGWVIDFLLKILFLETLFDEWAMLYFRFFIWIVLIWAIWYWAYYLTRIYIGKRLYNRLEIFTSKVPIIWTVYKVSKDFLKLFDGKNKKKAKLWTVVLVEYPKDDSYVLWIVNITKDTLLKDLVSVYIPTAPNPTSWYNILVSKHEVKLLNISIEDMMKYTISLGSVEIDSFMNPQQSFQDLQTIADLDEDGYPMKK